MRAAGKYRVALLLLGLMASLLSACSGLGNADDREDRDPLIRRARERRAARDFDGSIELYTRALDRKPDLANAHLEMGLIFGQEKHDDLRAIYHYQRYLELRPNAEKRDLVEKLIQHAKISFAASLPDRPAEAVREIEMLRREVKTLRQMLDAQKGGAGATGSVAVAAAAVRPAAAAPVATAPAPSATVPAAAPATLTPPAATAAATQSYTVRAGDTLSRIATRVYNDPGKWDLIYQANRNQLATPQSLRVGQSLVVPTGGGR